MIAVPRPAALWVQLRRWRWPAALGSMLACVGLLLAVVVVPSLQREQAALDQQATSLRSRLAQRGNSTPPATPGSEALRYRDGFPQPSSRQQRVAALLNAARDAGLAPKRSEFRYEADRSTGLARYRVALPLEGRYAQLRGFIDSALRADAALSLDSVRLRRSSPQQPLLQAELAFTLHMRDADARAANERAANERAEGVQPSSTP